MRRGATLMVPKDWFISVSVPFFGFYPYLPSLSEHEKVLREYGCSEDALQWLDRLDFQMDAIAILYRFISLEEGDTRLPVLVSGSRPTFVTVEELNAMCKNTSRLKGRYSVSLTQSKEIGVALSRGRVIERPEGRRKRAT